MLLRLFFVLLIGELFVGGGGRLFEIGPFTLRMVLFSIALLMMLVPQFWRRSNSDLPLALGMVIAFFLVHLPAVMVGLVRGVDSAIVFGELQPLLYWLMAPFFAQIFVDRKFVDLTSQAIRASGIAMALAYLLLIAGLLVGFFDFLGVVNLLGATGEFFFRGDQGLFVYKGFLYLCIGLVFLVALKTPAKKIWIGVVAIAIVLTLTRGFMFSTAIAIAALLWASGRRRLVGSIMVSAVLIGAVVLAGDFLTDAGILARKDTGVSNAARIDDILYMLETVDAVTLVFGNGFGSLISGSRLNIENSYLWIWWKLGFAGLLFWASPLVLCAMSFRRIAASSADFPLACAFFFSVILVYLQTAANPYLNNPIGLSFIILAVFGLRRIAVAQRELGHAEKSAFYVERSALG